MRRIVLILCILFPHGPAVAGRADAWIGADRSALVAAFGQPQEIRSDGQGGTILVYAALRTLDETLGEASAPTPDLDETLHLGARLYFVDASGKIYGKLDALNL
jgi:hypothetical protein